MKKRVSKFISLALTAAMVLSLAGCGSSDSAESAPAESGTETTASGETANSTEESTQTAASGEKIVNIGVTDSLGSINPFVIDQTFINKYAVDLQFLPLVEFDENLNFEYILADSITTEDNKNFIVHINDDATWSDGNPITAYDVEYSFLRLASPIVANATLVYNVFEGVGDDGFVEEGATGVSGVQVIDDKTIQFTTKEPMSMITFQSAYACYLHTMPKHVIEKFSEAELTTQDWFNHPDVVSGPFMVTDYDTDHYISYVANKNYWKGAPKIDKLNIKIVDSSQVYSGLQSGEIDVTHHTMTNIPQEDMESIEALDNVNVVYGSPVTNQSVFIQTENIPDVRVRQALVYAIDRQKIVDELLKGHGEVVEGFLSSASPYYDDSITPYGYDPEKAKELLAEAGWDGSQTLRFFVNSGDGTFVNAAQVMVAQWAAVGIKVEVQTVDLATLMSMAGSTDYDLFAVQYTYPPIDPSVDIAWLLSGAESWTGYSDPSIDEALGKVGMTEDIAGLKELYATIDKKVQEDVPMFSAYIISAQGAVSKRLTNVHANVYGFFNNIQEWDVVE
ncbi:MAG: ABC transporter substrate-binding protein [Lachnospiraceae bacterium]|nr:ABC transporter substrate-binding protein [Lachnospiraceae bacterium]MCI7191479.1 ABC transporter substrate-binding protein [Lachnospiraceae bacterium]MDD7628587.1 ABC transporter substrate-binding protein [Lachnospiraceae bacterium]MDY4120113.1 ABC transporter substrate-binding protein [Lachnospiraceae bacterium]